MTNFIQSRRHIRWFVFFIVFGLFASLGGLMDISTPVAAAPPVGPSLQQDSYAGSQSCAQCHENIHSEWIDTRHAHAYSSPIFQRDWEELDSQTSCLQCHTTGFDPTSGLFAEEGVTCESCHGPFQPGHPAQLMPVTPDAELCSTCHETTTNEWHASVHSQAGIQCQACHNPHSQTPKAESVTALCQNCHKERGESFTHSTHADSGLQCSNCHMYTPPRDSDPILGLVPTGHTFSVGSDACIGCHQDTVHTRDELIKLTGEDPVESQYTVEDLQVTIHDQEQEITNLEAINDIRLYTGLIQGAIIGLVTGGAAAWVVSRRIQVVEVDGDE